MAGTKCDLVNKELISLEKIACVANGFGIEYAVVSSKSGEGVEELFSRVVEKLRKTEELCPSL
jgi:hypothetical protein